MSDKKKILFIISGLGVGGAEIALRNLLYGLKDDFNIKIVSLTQVDDIAAEIKAYGITVHQLNFKQLYLLSLQIYKFISIILKFKPDILQGWMYHGNLFACIAKFFSYKTTKLFLGIRQSLKGLSTEKRATRLAIRLDALASSKVADKIIYNSYSGMEEHEKYGYAKQHGIVIYNGFDINLFSPNREQHKLLCEELNIAQDSYLIGIIARYHPVKDHKTFIHAAQILLRDHRNTHFIMVGEGVTTDNKDLAQLISRYNIPKNNMHLLGLRKDISAITSGLDIATNCSLSEGAANSMCEALSCGVLCVATDVGDSKKIIGECGLIIPTSSSHELANAWRNIIDMPKNRYEQLSYTARQKIIKQLSMEAMILKYKALFMGEDI